MKEMFPLKHVYIEIFMVVFSDSGADLFLLAQLQ